MKIIWLIIYNLIFNPFFAAFVFLLFSPVRKVRETLLLHKDLWERLKKINPDKEPMIWFHASSAGEYLMIKPVLEELLKKKIKVFVSLTSISGYRWIKKENPGNFSFDFMPLDFFYNSSRLVRVLSPSALIFIRNDIWPNLKNSIIMKKIPLFFMGAPARNTDSLILKSFYKFLYGGFTKIFTITKEATDYQKNLHKKAEVVFTGDTKFDIVEKRKKERKIVLKQKGNPTVLLGSVWPKDLEITIPVLQKELEDNPKLKIIIAPHEIKTSNLNYILYEFDHYQPVLFSSYKEKASNFRVLIVDTIGDLFYLYQNSQISYIGGGFNSGIHNILEPAAMGNVVIFGPKHQKFPEADILLNSGAAFEISSRDEFSNRLKDLLKSPGKIKKLGEKNLKTAMENTGATRKVLKNIMDSVKLK